MTTIRRIYLYTVCFISLQWAAISIKSLMDATLRWLLTVQRSSLGELVFPLAVILVGLPVFAGHWLWAQWLSRRDPGEASSLARQLYLALSVALLTAYSAVAVYSGIEALMRLILVVAAPELLASAFTALPQARALSLADLLSSLPTLAATLGLWLYHRQVQARDEQSLSTPAARTSDLLGFLVSLAFTATGAALVAGGLYTLQDTLLSMARERSLQGLSIAVGMLAAGGALFVLHERLLARQPGVQAGYKRILRSLVWQVFSLAGLVLSAAGLVTIQTWLFHRLSGRVGTDLPTGISLLTTGLLLFIYHERSLRRHPGEQLRNRGRYVSAGAANLAGLVMGIVGAINLLDWLFSLPGGGTSRIPDDAAAFLPGLLIWLYYEEELLPVRGAWRWWQALAYSLPGLVISAAGLGRLQAWMMSGLSRTSFSLGDALAWLLTGGAILVYYEHSLHKRQPEGSPQARWLAAWLVYCYSAAVAIFGLNATLRMIFIPGRAGFDEVANGLLTGVVLGLYYQWVMGKFNERRIALLVRLSVYAFSGLGVLLTAFGLVGVGEWLFGYLTGERLIFLPDALAALVAGLPTWLYFWRWAGRLFFSMEPAERKSDLRKLYLYLVVYLAVNTAVITGGLLLNGMFLNLFDVPTQGGLGLLLAILIASTCLWVYHDLTLRGDIRLAGETALQGSMQRLYWYIVAGTGLLATVLGAAGSLGALLRLLAVTLESGGAPIELRQQLAASLAAFLAGLPVWLTAWIPAQRAARGTDEAAAPMRRSFLRKAYLYLTLLFATLSVLVFAVRLVWQLLTALFGLFEGVSVLAEIGESIGFTVIGAILWAYHMWVLRGDGRLEMLEKAGAAEKAESDNTQALETLRRIWAEYVIVVVDDGSGQFGRIVAGEIARQLPHLNVRVVGLPAVEADNSEEAHPSADDTLPENLGLASLITAPWTEAGPGSPVALSETHKLVVPVEREGMQWVGVRGADISPTAIVHALRQALPKRSLPPEEDQQSSLET